MAQSPAKPKAAVPTPSAGGGRRPYVVPCPITYPPSNHAWQSSPYGVRGTVVRCAGRCRHRPLQGAYGVTNRQQGGGALDGPRRPPPQGRRWGPWGRHGRPRGLRPLRRALGTMGCFAPCAARVFRPLRRAGVSLAAASDRGRCPLDPCDFLKKSSKTFYFWCDVRWFSGRAACAARRLALSASCRPRRPLPCA